MSRTEALGKHMWLRQAATWTDDDDLVFAHHEWDADPDLRAFWHAEAASCIAFLGQYAPDEWWRLQGNPF